MCKEKGVKVTSGSEPAVERAHAQTMKNTTASSLCLSCGRIQFITVDCLDATERHLNVKTPAETYLCKRQQWLLCKPRSACFQNVGSIFSRVTHTTEEEKGSLYGRNTGSTVSSLKSIRSAFHIQREMFATCFLFSCQMQEVVQ